MGQIKNIKLHIVTDIKANTMKLYFHLQLVQTGSFITAAVETEGTDDKLKGCLKNLCDYLYEKRKMDIDVNHLQLFNEKKKSVSLDAVVSSFTNGVDITVKVDESATKNKIIYEKSDIKSSSDSSIGPGKACDVAGSGNTESIAPLLKKASKHLSNKRHDLALNLYNEVLKTQPNNHDATFGLAYIFFNAERYKEATTYFEKLISKSPADEVLLLDFSRALIHSGDAAKAASMVSRCINDLKRSNKPVEQVHDANVVLAEALESMGQLPNAFQLYLTVSQMTEKQHLAALIGYARIGYQIKHVTLDDVFIVILNAVAHHKNDTKFHSYFADMVRESGGFDALRKQMHDLWFDAKTVLYIGTFLRECGALDECLKLVKHAFSLDKTNTNIALLILHVHENLCTIEPGLIQIAEFLNAKLSHQIVRKIDLSPFTKVIKFLEKKETNALEEYLTKQLAPEKAAKRPSPKGNLSNMELDLLGLYFTIVKTCYVNGHLNIVPLFIKLMDPLYKMNDDLHKTSIRNEQAYYSCISKIYETSPPPTCAALSLPKLFFIGDSHVLPVAWRTIKGSNGNEYCVNPVLVTGLKIWHLRKESRFYTKASYHNALKAIPQGAACVFALGEIDCREGIEKAIQKCKYDNIDEGMKALIEIYVKCLLEVKKMKKAKIFVHPVSPALKETFVNVEKFNQHLKNRILKTPKLLWLDFFDQLVGENNALKDEYQFEGTHLHPKYVSLLEGSLQKHL